jgi:hypothetical protein
VYFSEKKKKKKQLLNVLEACLYGGYDDRISTMSKYFSGSCDDCNDESLLWPEFEVIIRTVSETTALTLRDELTTFVGFNEKHPSVLQSLKSIEKMDIIPTVEVMTEATVTKEETSMKTDIKEKSDDSSTTTTAPAKVSETPSSTPVTPGPVDWCIAYPPESGHRKLIFRHARIWLLHDFDHIQKWRCWYPYKHILHCVISFLYCISCIYLTWFETTYSQPFVPSSLYFT